MAARGSKKRTAVRRPYELVAERPLALSPYPAPAPAPAPMPQPEEGAVQIGLQRVGAMTVIFFKPMAEEHITRAARFAADALSLILPPAGGKFNA
jgi:hypothetical protein